MFTILPDFTPRDSHSLWYTSSRTPLPSATSRDAHHADSSAAHSSGHASHSSRSRSQILERTALARLAADEQFLSWRQENAQNFGSAWLKPPGVAKTLHQMREEKREQEEHQEALRREQLAQELAEAEAGGMPDDMMDDVQLDGAQDLDDEIPDAGDPFGMDDDDDEENDDADAAADDTEVDDAALREERQNDLVAARMRMNDDAFREALVRGDPDGDDMYGGEEELEDESQGQMLDEEDLALGPNDDAAAAIDMDADLDADIPEAESGDGYEHTDSEADISSSSHHDGNAPEEEPRGSGAYDSSDDDDGHHDTDDLAGHEVGFVPRAAPLGPPQSPTTMVGRTNASGPRDSMNLSNLAPHNADASGYAESSPAQSRRARRG